MMERVLTLIGILLLAVTQFSVVADAGENQAAQTIYLKELMATDTPVILRSAQSEYSFSIPLSARVQVEKASLDLRFTNSISLTARSQLKVALNDMILAQVPLRARSPEGRVSVRLPVALLKQGYNKLTFSVAQHYTESCEDPSSPELWTQIDTAKSALTFKSTYKPSGFRLNNLADLIDRKLWSEYRLRILTTSDNPNDDTLAAGALVAQSAALLLDYVPLVVSHKVVTRHSAKDKDQQRFPGLDWRSLGGGDGVLIGTNTELKDLVAKQILDKVTGPYLAIFPNEVDPAHFLLVVSGRDNAELQLAAQVLALRGATLPALQHVVISDAILHNQHGYQRPNAITSDRVYSFTEFGFQSTTLQGMYPEPAQLRFWAAPDLFSPGDAAIAMHLHLAYGAGVDLQSTLNLFLNGQFEHAIHITEPHGVVYYDYIVKIPVASLQPGWNEISFRPSMLPANLGGQCQPIFTDNLLVTLFDDSYLKMDKVAHFTKLPNLQLIGRTGYPYTMNHDETNVSVQVTETDSATVSAAWTLMAKLAQIAKYPLLHAQVGNQIHNDRDHLIIIGREATIPAKLKAAAPGSLSTSLLSRISSRESNQQVPQTTDKFSKFTEWFKSSAPDEIKDQNEIKFSGDLNNSVILLQYESPFNRERSVLMLSALNSESLASEISALIQHKTWGKLAGGMFLWQTETQSAQQFESAQSFYIGDADLRSRIGFYFSDSPVAAILTILVGILLFVIVSRWLLVRFRRKHHPNVDDDA